MDKDKKLKLVEEKKVGVMEYPIIGKSRVVEQLHKQIARLSKSRHDVLIVGEAGVGKGAIAKNVYSMGRTSEENTPFMSINLSVLEHKELEAILFGFDRGTETNTYNTTKRGLFEIANNGTVLVEEIEEASFRNKIKILGFMTQPPSRRRA